MPPLVATTTCEASPDQVRSASATIFSLCPMVSQLGAKVSAVSKKVMPASRAACTVAMACPCGTAGMRSCETGMTPMPRAETSREPMRRVGALMARAYAGPGRGDRAQGPALAPTDRRSAAARPRGLPLDDPGAQQGGRRLLLGIAHALAEHPGRGAGGGPHRLVHDGDRGGDQAGPQIIIGGQQCGRVGPAARWGGRRVGER